MAKKKTAKKTPKKKPAEELKKIDVEYDPIHLSGDEEAIYEYEEENYGSVFLVDWKCDMEELYEDFSSRLPDREVTFEDPKKGFQMRVCCGGKVANLRDFDRVEFLKAVDRLTRGSSHEMRALADSLCSDTVAIIVKEVAWWSAMEKAFSTKAIRKVYVRLRDVK